MYKLNKFLSNYNQNINVIIYFLSNNLFFIIRKYVIKRENNLHQISLKWVFI